MWGALVVAISIPLAAIAMMQFDGSRKITPTMQKQLTLIKNLLLSENNVALLKVEFAERYLEQRGGLWLDVGAGIGDMVSVAGEWGYQAVGLELSKISVAFAKEVFGVDLLPMTMDEYLTENPDNAGNVSMVSMIGL